MMMVPNEDARSKDYDEIERTYRPSHADYTYDAKYGIRDHRGGGRHFGPRDRRSSGGWRDRQDAAARACRGRGGRLRAAGQGHPRDDGRTGYGDDEQVELTPTRCRTSRRQNRSPI